MVDHGSATELQNGKRSKAKIKGQQQTTEKEQTQNGHSTVLPRGSRGQAPSQQGSQGKYSLAFFVGFSRLFLLLLFRAVSVLLPFGFRGLLLLLIIAPDATPMASVVYPAIP
jgi:hypothetical protein